MIYLALLIASPLLLWLAYIPAIQFRRGGCGCVRRGPEQRARVRAHQRRGSPRFCFLKSVTLNSDGVGDSPCLTQTQ